jgi:hypothetical protein
MASAATTPISARTALYRGAIALAVNGVPIFNALNNRGEDAYLAGELDEYGGHCGRGDDYHYHIAPVHLEKVVGKGKPIAYALDGFPIYGFTDADDLDAFNGRSRRMGATATTPRGSTLTSMEACGASLPSAATRSSPNRAIPPPALPANRYPGPESPLSFAMTRTRLTR